MNDQFKIELQSLLARYPDVQGVTVKMVQTFEVKAASLLESGFSPAKPMPDLAPIALGDLAVNPNATMAALNAGVNELLKSK